jgi:uncharacterized lipoprotein YddW (UPF0748 family)
MQSRKQRTKKFLIILFFVFLLSASFSSVAAEIRGLWVTAWDLTTPDKIDQVIRFAENHNIKQIFAHIRYRSDALYNPNRIFDTYPNPEPKSYIINDDLFDPLAYLTYAAADKDLEIHAWVTVFVATPRTLENISPDHLYYNNNDWFTKDFLGTKMHYNSYEGAYLDPGIPEVHDYLINVFLDIITNYPVKGIQLDYIRYPDSQFGYNLTAMDNYSRSGYVETDFHKWREEQINRFVQRVYAEVKFHDPEMVVSAAVISDLNRARTRYSQNWTKWLEEGYIDYAYMMSYSRSDDIVKQELQAVREWKDRIVVGLRAWEEENRSYSPDLISSKIEISRKLGFSGIALFSYAGMKTNNNALLTRTLKGKAISSRSFADNIFFGYILDDEKRPLPKTPVYINNSLEESISDENGFFFFNRLKPGTYWLKSERDINVFFSGTVTFPTEKEVNCFKYLITFPD